MISYAPATDSAVI